MPGVLDNEQARRLSKAIDDEIKVALSLFLAYMRAYLILLHSAKRN
jgi:hypothetical protein